MTDTAPNANYLILSCDGGGIRGLITAMLLDDLNKKHPDMLNRVNLFAGTSTGGIIALGLAAGLPTSELVKLYSNEGATIFSRYDPGFLREIKYIWKYLRALGHEPDSRAGEASVGRTHHGAKAQPHTPDTRFDFGWHRLAGLFYVKYKHDGLLSIMKQILPPKTLGQLRPVMVTTFQLSDSENRWYPLQLHNLRDPKTQAESEYCDVSIYDAALATGAAPTYFPPHKVPHVGYCVDGGVYANSPSPLAVSLAVKNANASLSNIKVLGLGTGFTQECITSIGHPLKWGPAQWLMPHPIGRMPAMPLLEALMAGQMEVATTQSKLLLEPSNFMYANMRLKAPYPLDDYKNIQQLIDQTHDYINGAEWAEVVDWVGQHFC